jgi:hypothetical protein
MLKTAAGRGGVWTTEAIGATGRARERENARPLALGFLNHTRSSAAASSKSRPTDQPPNLRASKLTEDDESPKATPASLQGTLLQGLDCVASPSVVLVLLGPSSSSIWEPIAAGSHALGVRRYQPRAYALIH